MFLKHALACEKPLGFVMLPCVMSHMSEKLIEGINDLICTRRLWIHIHGYALVQSPNTHTNTHTHTHTHARHTQRGKQNEERAE